MITPESLAAAGTEHAHQKAVFCWAANNFNKWPELQLMFAIPNGGLRDKITAGKLKAEGVKAGVPDIFLPIPKYNAIGMEIAGLFIELKRPKSIGMNKGIISIKQSDWIDKLRVEGYRAETCFGWQEAVEVIEGYLS